MCYSALVKRSIRKTARYFRAQIDHQAFLDLYQLRDSIPDLKIPVGMADDLITEGGPIGKTIQALEARHLEREDGIRQQQLADLAAELEELEQRLRVKPTKTMKEKLAAKLRKQAKLQSSKDPVDSRDSYRIYPNYFAPVIWSVNGKRSIVPMRYRILPRSGVEVPSKYNVFNARRDSLLNTRTWKPLFGQNHIIFPFVRFYEWVELNGAKQEISFSPEGHEWMWSAGLYDVCNSEAGAIRSFAMVTDDPPDEVRNAGHDRCPIFLAESLIDSWLRAGDRSLDANEKLLDHKQPTYYFHEKVA